jgi:hypothetical protein
MGEGDHSGCPVELLACPEHREAQLREMGLSGPSDRPDEGAHQNSACIVTKMAGI